MARTKSTETGRIRNLQRVASGRAPRGRGGAAPLIEAGLVLVTKRGFKLSARGRRMLG